MLKSCKAVRVMVPEATSSAKQEVRTRALQRINDFNRNFIAHCARDTGGLERPSGKRGSKRLIPRKMCGRESSLVLLSSKGCEGSDIRSVPSSCENDQHFA